MVKIFQALLSRFFKAFLQAFLNHLVGSLAPTLIQLIQDASQSDLTNEEKRNQVFQQAKTLAITAGKDIRDSSLNLAIETAVKILKGGA